MVIWQPNSNENALPSAFVRLTLSLINLRLLLYEPRRQNRQKCPAEAGHDLCTYASPRGSHCSCATVLNRDGLRYKRAPPQHFVNCKNQIEGEAWLGNVAAAPRTKRRSKEVSVFMNG